LAIFFSLFALGFTIYSFYWMNWRSGKLSVGAPKTFAAACSNGKVIVYLPLVFYNSGARPIIIQDLQLKFFDQQLEPLYFNATVEKLGTDEGRAYATQFPLNANTTLQLICEFQVKDYDFCFYQNEFSALLKARIDENDWKPIKTFPLYIGENASIGLASGGVVVIHSDF